jgi:predicted PurR-regulated permease PerM
LSRDRQNLFWIGGIIVFGLLLNLLSSVLLPFVAGMAVAYFLDPLADKLEEKGFSRTLATSVILLGFFLVAIGGVLLLIPVLQGQIVELAHLVPKILEAAHAYIRPQLEQLRDQIPPEALDRAREALGDFTGKGIKWVSQIIANIWSGGLAFFNLLSLVLITPIVAFYLLRDWDLITAKLDSLLPRPAAPAIRQQFMAIDSTIAGFVRGQASVCLVLSVIYGIGLTTTGLKSGLLVGLAAGLISFIPYLGAATGLSIGVGIALFQYSEIAPIATVAGIFIFGQTLESYVLTPRLVGDRVGLHPVWIMFALLAGGAVFGFTGVLLAVPTAAVIGVLVRFSISRYLASPLYTGIDPEDVQTSDHAE